MDSASDGIPQGWELGGHLTPGPISRTKQPRALPTIRASEPQFPSLYNGDHRACLQEDASQCCARKRPGRGLGMEETRNSGQPGASLSLCSPSAKEAWARSLRGGPARPCGQETAARGRPHMCAGSAVSRRTGLPPGAPQGVPAHTINCLVLPPGAPKASSPTDTAGILESRDCWHHLQNRMWRLGGKRAFQVYILQKAPSVSSGFPSLRFRVLSTKLQEKVAPLGAPSSLSPFGRETRVPGDPCCSLLTCEMRLAMPMARGRLTRVCA